jgi:hypothetical protein
VASQSSSTLAKYSRPPMTSPVAGATATRTIRGPKSKPDRPQPCERRIFLPGNGIRNRHSRRARRVQFVCGKTDSERRWPSASRLLTDPQMRHPLRPRAVQSIDLFDSSSTARVASRSGPEIEATRARGAYTCKTGTNIGPGNQRGAMSDKSPRQTMTKKSGSSLKEKRAAKRNKAGQVSQTEALLHAKKR